jgi:putative glutamine amidotransferase
MSLMPAPARWGGGPAARVPLIAVTTSEMRDASLDVPMQEGDPPRTEMALGMRYLEAVAGAGAIAVVVPPMPGPAIPALLAIVRAADERDLPILAICRGSQVLNVARGGTLHQHLPDVVGETIHHRQTQRSSEPTHGVTIAPDSRLAAILGRRETRVNSFHHQAVDVLGDRLRVTARAEDGTVEGVEAVDRRFVVGVQWHAECLVDLDEQAALFSALVAACAERAALATGTSLAVAGSG